MLTCIACSKQPGVESRDHFGDVNPNSKQAIKSLTSQHHSSFGHFGTKIVLATFDYSPVVYTQRSRMTPPFSTCYKYMKQTPKLV
ncbi:hypothetical protein LguiB_019730 [Lonicera macranthoides]